MSYIRAFLKVPLIKYAVIAVLAILWGLGFMEQLYSEESIQKYVLISLAMVAIAFL
jgi:hypothetical protein